MRLGADRRWTDDPPSDDAAGRAVLGLGTAAAQAPWPSVRLGALELFDEAARFRSGHLRALGYAVLGAAEVLRVLPDHAGARRLVADAADALPHPAGDAAWPWPEPRLAYANAPIPKASLVAATLVGRRDDVDAALALLEWLVAVETWQNRFSFTPVGGRGPGDLQPAFDQQPIEAWAMADACARAYSCTKSPDWAQAAWRTARWFVSENDSGALMFDAVTGGGYDGLERSNVNRNQGAESSLAFAAAMRVARTVRLSLSHAVPHLSPAPARAARR